MWLYMTVYVCGDVRTNLKQNQLMQQHPLPHVGEGDTAHDDQRPDHVSLRPALEDESRWLRGLGDLSCGQGAGVGIVIGVV